MMAHLSQLQFERSRPILEIVRPRVDRKNAETSRCPVWGIDIDISFLNAHQSKEVIEVFGYPVM
jgi:hypothetical protein